MASAETEENLFIGFTAYDSPLQAGLPGSHPQPGDIILRVGSEGSPLSIEAPFPGGVRQVVDELQRRLRSDHEWVELLLARQNGTLAMLVPLSRFTKRKKQGLFEVKELGLFAECQLKEGSAEMFLGIEMRLGRTLWDADSRQLASLSIGEQEVDEQPGSLPSILSVMVYPTKDSNGRFHDVTHTGARATNWLARAQASGVALNLLSISSEVVPIPQRATGATASEKLRKQSTEGKWAARVGMSYFRCARLWLQPHDETRFTLNAVSPDARNWNMVINKTDEGFLYIQSVDPHGEAAKCGLDELHRIVSQECKLVIRAMNDINVTPKVLSNGKVVTAKMDDILKLVVLHLHLRRPLTFDFIFSSRVGQLARQVQQVGTPVTFTGTV